MAEICRLSENVSFDLGAILEPLGVAIHASRRARIARDSSTLVFGAGAVGLLCAAMSKVEGSSNVTIADIQAERVDFAINNGFAHRGFVVPRKQGQDIEERLRLAKVTAAIAAEIKTVGGCSLGEYDTVFECTGVESCTQAAIYVRSKHHHMKYAALTAAGNTRWWKSCDSRYGKSCTDVANLSSCTA